MFSHSRRLLDVLVVLALALVPVASCSLVIDLPADCVPADCNGYQCNAERTECLFECRSDDDCDESHVCNVFVGRGSCVETGCEVQGEWAPLVPDLSRSNNLGFDYNGQHIGLAYVNNVGLHFQLLDPTGASASAPVLLDDLSLTPSEPAVKWNGTAWAVVWDSITLYNSKNRETLRYATLAPDGTLTLPAKSLWVNLVSGNRGEKSVDSAFIDWDETNQLYAITWSTKVAVGSDIYLMLIRSDGSNRTGEEEIDHDLDVFRVTNTAVDSISPAVAVVERGGPTHYDVVFREGDGLWLRTLDATGTLFGEDVNLATVEGSVASSGFTELGTGAAVAFAVGGDSPAIFRTQLDANRGVLGGSSFPVGEGANTPDDANVSSLAQGEYAVTFIAESMGTRGFFMVRYKDNGAVIGFPRRLSANSVAATRPQAIATDLGYLVLYQENEGPDAGAVMSALVTCDPSGG